MSDTMIILRWFAFRLKFTSFRLSPADVFWNSMQLIKTEISYTPKVWEDFADRLFPIWYKNNCKSLNIVVFL